MMCDVAHSLCQHNEIVTYNKTVDKPANQEVWYKCGSSTFFFCELAKKRNSESTVMDRLWAESQTEVRQVLKTDMIQGLIDGSVDPYQFAAFLINDVYYISRGPQTYSTALAK